MFLEDEKLNPCECGAEPCVPGIRMGPTVLNYDEHSYRVICLACWKKGQVGRTIADATGYWNAGHGKSRLKSIRLEMGLTQEKLSELTGVHYNMIGLYERGVAMPVTKTRMKLEAVLGEVW